MSRPRNFPETIYVGMNRKGDVYLIPDKDPVLFITTTGICKTMSYRINSFYCKLALKASKPDPTPEATKSRKPEALPTALETESRPKRYRRTKAEIEMAGKAEKEFAKQMREVPLDKPKWKCPDDNCGWMGNAPPRAIMGINTSKLICPECKMVVLKNE
jgi:hypothetical protein